MSAVLVTSATSAAGFQLCRALSRGMQVLASGPEPAAPLLTRCGIRYAQADLSHSRSRRTLLFGPALELGVETVVHASVDRDRPHAEADAVRELLHLCERHATIRGFVHRSTAEVYRVRAGDPALIDEDHPLETGALATSRLRDRIEADQAACAHAGLSRLRICVLRCAELFAPDAGGPLQGWLRSSPCLRPAGFDPVVNLISESDLVRAVVLAVESRADGVFNVPGADTLPLSELAVRMGRPCLPAPECVCALRYSGGGFRYRPNRRRFHFAGVLCGKRARDELGYEPQTGIRWPAAPWPRLLEGAAP